jgi:hypothetical protein
MKITFTEKLKQEIQNTCAAKLGNIQRGTATGLERAIVGECQGYICLLEHSCLTPREVYEAWSRTDLKYR